MNATGAARLVANIEVVAMSGQQGFDRMMLQTFDMEDLSSLKLIAKEVIPHV